MNVTRSICVHVGLPKTATTSLQRGLFARHPDIEYLGKLAGQSAREAPRRCASEAAFRLGNQLFWDSALEIDVEQAKQIYEKELGPTLRDGRLPVYSFEGLSAESLERREAIARNLRAVFEDCRVLIGIRRPIDLIESLYFQRLRRAHFGRRARRFDFRSAATPAQWLASVEQGRELANHLDYARTIRLFLEALGRSHVAVLPFERLKAEPTRFSTELCRFLEIDPELGIRLLEGRHDNPRITQESLDRMSAFARGRGSGLVYGMAGRSLRRRWAGLRRPGGHAARLDFGASFRGWVDAQTREGNRWISDTFGLDLGGDGYAV